ncbi:MAG TPA: lactate racemase domain-containing protein [Mycobacteriales bacterium]|nr:lactate racemase domain-containing protein [Mycobacteriales bacterium]
MSADAGRAAASEWFEVRRDAPPAELDLPAAVEVAVKALVQDRIRPGARVGVAVGSRGIAGIAVAVAALVSSLRAQGAEPVIIPAMGSHGGATEAGQQEVLRELGVNAGELGVTVDPAMDVDVVGTLPNGLPVHLARSARRCDLVVPVNRVKPHSDFQATVESGLTKMMAIGLGKERGASTLHRAGFAAFGEILPAAARLMFAAIDVPFGLALLEDAWHRTRRVEAVPGEQIIERDAQLLEEARAHLGRLPFPEVDVLILKEMGKNISGAGMDPNVTGRFAGAPFDTGITVNRLAVLDLTEESGGNAIGVGVADFVTERLRSKVDWPATYANSFASKSPASGKLPFVVRDDAAAVELAVDSLIRAGDGPVRMVAAANTLEVNHLAVSECLLDAADAAGYERVGGGAPAEFDGGTLVRIGGLEFFG